ncbi:amidohydrolase family protein [Luteolibacter yonseiensis]|uniref:Amidohydrolase family protein n=1 Tax=Luteolibacter yonseiensis TaxID=1144680 RepID=A0A934VD78_9BACT|nr:amidohydrolase family protein [Luteolibacter yonseiensis]MBK1817746.1 amidohydrolase family protein [Luteolibacter yonseiensis]
MIDSHHHLWSYSAGEYPWIPPGSPLANDHLLTELEQATASAGVDATVVVQARQVVEESHRLLSLADRSELIAGVVGWVPLVDENVAEPLARLAAHDKFKGVRHVLQDEPDDYFLRDDFHRGLSLLPDLDLRYDLLVYQNQLPASIRLVDRQPDLGIIIDHIAKPRILKGRIDPAWKAGMTELAKRENILGVKISGMVTEVSDPEIDEDTLRAYFEETLRIFGVDRLMFGTDWPVCLLRVDSCQTWTEMFRRFTASLSSDEKAAVGHDNAARIYGL